MHTYYALYHYIQDVIGWRPVGSARRIVLALTDGDYHTALDGRVYTPPQ